MVRSAAKKVPDVTAERSLWATACLQRLIMYVASKTTPVKTRATTAKATISVLIIAAAASRIWHTPSGFTATVLFLSKRQKYAPQQLTTS